MVIETKTNLKEKRMEVKGRLIFAITEEEKKKLDNGEIAEVEDGRLELE